MMNPNPRPLEIYLARLQINECNDLRPCVIIAIPRKDTVKIAGISSAIDFYSPTRDFFLDMKHPDFIYTSLKRSSFVFGDFVEIPISCLSSKPIGVITGNLAALFTSWL